MLVSGFGAIFGYMSVLPVMVRNFSVNQRGRIIGILDSFFSIGPAIFAAIYGASFINGHVSDEENQDLWGFFLFNAVAFAVVFGLGVLLVRPISCEETDMSENSHLITPQASSVINQAETDVREPPPGKSDLTGCAPFCDGEFHLMLWPFVLCTSLQLMFLNNIPAYLKSFNHESYNTLLTVLAPVVTVLSKLLLGLVSDLTLERMPRVSYQLICNVLQTVFLLLCIFFVDNMLFFLFATIAVSIANGAAWCITPAMVTDMFGTRYLGRNWGWLLIGVAIGGLALQTAFGFLYDRYLDEERNCYGTHCFMWSFVIVVILSFLATMLNGALLFVIMKQRRAIYNRLHES